MASSVVEMRKPVIAEDDGVRERHGLKAYGQGSVLLREDGNLISIDSYAGERNLTPKQARYLARKLYHLARRIERREVGK